MKRKLVLDDIYKLDYVSDPQISANGELVAFVKTIPNKEQNEYHSSIWIVEKDKQPYCVSDGYENSTMPRWCPDGNGILFLSAQSGISQFYKYLLNGITIEQLTFDETTKNFPVWSPDGSKVAFVATQRLDNELKEADRYNTLKIRSGSSFIDFSVDKSIMVLDIATNELKRITPNDFYLNDPEYSAVFNPSWSSDGQNLVFAAQIQDQAEADKCPWKADIYVVSVNGGKPKAIRPSFEYASKRDKP